MRIVIDARMYGDFGIGRYNKNMVSSLQEIDTKNEQSSFAPQNEYFILHTKKDYDDFNYKKNFKKIKANFHWYGITEQIKLPQILKKINPDLVHFPHFNVPIFYNGKFVVTIHDLTHQYYDMKQATTHSSFIYAVKQLGYKKVFKNAIFKSEKILVPSNYVKGLLIKEWKVPESKIVVTYEAVDDKIFAIANILSSDSQENSLNRYRIKPPYIFYIGNAHPHKNVNGLIKSFLKLKEKKELKNLKLVLAGHDEYFWPRIKNEYNQKDIIYTGRISDLELVALYKNAWAFVMPSFEEGFGIPLLEAMACGTPVVSSNVASLPEIGGDAVIYFDPKNIDDMAEKISQVLGSEKLRKELIVKGQKRCQEFSWQKLAKQTLEVYNSV